MNWLDRFWNRIIAWLFDEQPEPPEPAKKPKNPTYTRPVDGYVEREDGTRVSVMYVPIGPMQFQALYKSTGQPVYLTDTDKLHVDALGRGQSIIMDFRAADFFEEDESPAEIIKHFEVAEKGITGSIIWTGSPLEGIEFNQPSLPNSNIQGEERMDVWSIRCPQCNKVSYNINDVKNRYCGGCHIFH